MAPLPAPNYADRCKSRTTGCGNHNHPLPVCDKLADGSRKKKLWVAFKDRHLSLSITQGNVVQKAETCVVVCME